jgi:prepilin-type N-terminal cleavage/methylation domain-containing protein
MIILCNNKKLKGFSLVETLVTLVVVGIIIIMLTNVLSITLRVSVLASERSLVKDEMSTMLQKLDRDVSNAEYIFIDPAATGTDSGAIIIETTEYRSRWQRCPNDNPNLQAGNTFSLCQTYCQIDNTDLDSTSCTAAGARRNFISTPKLVIESFRVEEITSTTAFDNQRIKSAVVTIKARHAVESLGIINIYKQITISSNNFII